MMPAVEWHPDIQYARSADGTSLGYAVLSEGSKDILLAIGMGTNLGVDITEEPGVERWYDRLAKIGRLVAYDQRGAGVSDPVAMNDVPTIERIAEDMEAVLDAANVERATIVALTSLGPAAMLLAATRPERVSALVLYGTYARLRAAPDYPAGLPDEVADRFVDFSRTVWGTGAMLEVLAPSRADDPAYRERFAQVEKLMISPTQSAILSRMGIEYDVRPVLGSISAPTLVIHRTGDRFVPVAHGRYLAEHIHGARLLELEGEDHAYNVGDVDSILDAIVEFVTGERSAPPSTRVLATVLFTDIVGSTEAATHFGDQRWRELLDQHDRAGRRQLGRFGGKLVKSTGDGVMATFDGPTKAVLCAAAIRDAVKVLGLDVRAGIHAGEVEVRDSDIGGIAVHIAARIAALAGPGEVVVSRTITDLVAGSGIEFDDLGPRDLKGVQGTWNLYAVRG
jgi:class 3 adenylate cyclase